MKHALILAAALIVCGCSDDDRPTGFPLLIFQQDSLRVNVSGGVTWERDCVPCPTPQTAGCGQSPCPDGEYRVNTGCQWGFDTEGQSVAIGPFALADYDDVELTYEVDGSDVLQEVRINCTAYGYSSRNINDFTDKPPVTIYFEFSFAWESGASHAPPGQEYVGDCGPRGYGVVRNIVIRGRR